MSKYEQEQLSPESTSRTVQEVFSPLIESIAGIGSVVLGAEVFKVADTLENESIGVLLIGAGAYVAVHGLAKSLRSIQENF